MSKSDEENVARCPTCRGTDLGCPDSWHTPPDVQADIQGTGPTIVEMEGFEHTIVGSPSPSTLVGRDQDGNWVYDSDSEFLFSVGPLDSIADDSFYFSAMSHPMHFAIHRKYGHSYLVAGKSWDGVNHGIKKLKENVAGDRPTEHDDCGIWCDGTIPHAGDRESEPTDDELYRGAVAQMMERAESGEEEKP